MKKENIRTVLLLILYTIVLILGIINFRSIVQGLCEFFSFFSTPFLAIVIAFIFNRPFVFFKNLYNNSHLHIKESLAKSLSIITIYVITFGAFLLLMWLVLPQLKDNIVSFANNVDVYLSELQSFINMFTNALGFHPIDFSALTDSIDVLLQSFIKQMNTFAPQILEVTENIISALGNFFMALILAVYMLFNKEKLLHQIKIIVDCYLPDKLYIYGKEIYDSVITVFGDYISGQCKEALILGSLCFIGMMILRLDYAALISVIIGVTALVPILGAYIGGFIGVFLLLFISPEKAIIFLIFLVILQQIEGNFIYPKVVGRTIGLSGMWVLIAIIAGGKWNGIIGMLIGVPLTAVLYRLVKQDVTRKRHKKTG